MLDVLIVIFDFEAELSRLATERHVLVALGDEIEVTRGAGLGGFFCVGGSGGEGSPDHCRKGTEA